MAIAGGASIEAVLTLNASGFETALSNATNSVKNFIAQVNSTNVNGFVSAIRGLETALADTTLKFTTFQNQAKGIESFNKFANGVKALATAVDTLGKETDETSVGMTRVKEIITSLEGTFGATEVKITGLTSSLKSLANSSQNSANSVKTQFSQLASSINPAKMSLIDYGNTYRTIMTQMNTTTSQGRQNLALYHQNLKALALGVEQFNAIETNATNVSRNFTTAINAERMSLVNLDGAVRKSINDITQYTSATTRATASTQRQATANRTATASSNQFATATSGLGRALSSLRMMGTMVGSMLAYNFVHHLAQATNETIQSKSEMEGYFKMLGYGQGEIQRFNNALDQTVARFQRVNKYSLGETISSIGVEFNLTTDEMIKAMDVTSMITSEYLRAGRNANEASLAVKDVLQGQFQRLSRETGVKGEQLKEAGWSGDVNDVNSLLDALRKVAEDRNWDVFAEKANSLNVVQPSIVGAFNAIMMVGGAFGEVLTGVWEWINGDGLLNQAVKWGAIATAIGTVVTALVAYRTGANLTQMVQMGLRGSITATIFSLKAEEVATYGSRNALVAKITSLKAEQVAEMGTLRAITTRVLGLKSESVASMGVKGAIMESVLARKMEEAEMRNATLQQKIAIASEHQSQVAKMGTLRTIFAKIAGVNMETFAEKGLIVALAERVSASLPYVSALKAEEVAEMSTAEAGLFLTASLAPLIAILAGVVAGVYALIKPLQDASEEMKKFNNILNNGDDIVKEHRKTYDSLTKSQSKAEEELGNLTKGTNEYIRKEEEVKALKEDVKTAQDNLTNSYKAYQRVVSANAKFEEESTKIRIHGQTRLKDAYTKAGIASARASELVSSELREAERGAEQLRRTLQVLKVEADRASAKDESIIGKLDAYGVSDEDIEKYGKNLADAQDKISQGLETFMTSDDWMERVKGWFQIQQGRIEEWWTEFNALFQIRDWDGMRDSILEGLNYIITGFGAFDWITPLKEAIGEKGLVGVIMDALFGEGDSDGALDIIWSWADSMILTPIANWLNWFMEDPFAHFDQTMDSFSLALGKLLFGNDSGSLRDIASEWFNNSVITPINEWLNWFFEDPISHFDMVMDDASLWVAKLLFGENNNVSLRDMVGIWLNDNIVEPFKQYLYNGIMSIPLLGDILQLLQTITGANPNAQDKGSQLARAFGNAVQNIVRNIPILGDVLAFLGVIPQAKPTASNNGHSIGDAIKTGFKNGLNGIVDIIRNELNHIVEAIGNKIDEAKQRASDLGNAIVSGVRNAIDPGSPGIIARSIIGNEFGTYIPQVISDNGELAYSTAQQYGEQIKAGISSVNTDSLGLDTAVGNYETDAQMIAMSSQMMGMETTTAFNDMSLAVNNTTATMSANVGTTYSQMQQKQTSSLQSMKTQNQTAYNEMYLKSNQSLIQMRDSTSNITQQMVSAWSHMKTQLVATANQLRSESTNHFNKLSDTIGSFYRKIQNPSNWGAGTGSSTPVRSRRNTTAGRSFARGMRTRTSLHGAGTSSTYTGSKYMTIGSLKRKLCPDGSCDYLFNGMDSSERVNVEEFLATITGEHGFGGWSGWNTTHFNHIKNTSDQWDMKSPVIQVMGGIPTNAQFKVGDFENGTPSISFDSFKSMAESIFAPGGIPYKHYMDSAWKGSWLGAIQAGACNCSDGAEAIIAFASACGFGGGQKVHGYWGNEGHFWAVINGEVFDTTAMQKGYGWRSPSVHGYGTKVRTTVSSGDAPSNGNKTVNVTIDMSNSTIYGVDDLDSRIKTGVEEGLKEQFNDPYTVELI